MALAEKKPRQCTARGFPELKSRAPDRAAEGPNGSSDVADLPTHEEHILYLMIELDEALARKRPQWTPEQRKVVGQRWAGLLEKLLAIYPGHYGQQ
jgi:hypothetical protein